MKIYKMEVLNNKLTSYEYEVDKETTKQFKIKDYWKRINKKDINTCDKFGEVWCLNKHEGLLKLKDYYLNKYNEHIKRVDRDKEILTNVFKVDL